MYKLYSNIKTHETFLECWGASTKHPDSKFNFKSFDLIEWMPSHEQIVPWIFECASKMVMPSHAYGLAKWGCKLYENNY